MATTFRTTAGEIVDLSEVKSSASAVLGKIQFQPGTTVRGTDGSEWIYVKAASATPRYTLQYLLTCNTASFEVAQCTTGLLSRPVFVTNSSMDSGAFGWVQAAGRCLVIANGTISAVGAPVWAAASGTFTDASTSADCIYGMTTFATGSGTLGCYLHWPFIGAAAFRAT